MNDFTKEELEYLRHCVVTDIDMHNYHIDSKPNMTGSKIQSMIDNYCEHEGAFYFNADGSAVKCQKCWGIFKSNDELNQQRLKEELIFCIRQFHSYAAMNPLDRNNFVVFILQNLLKEAQKMQLEESSFDV